MGENKQNELLLSLNKRLRFLEDILSVPSMEYPCMEDETKCPLLDNKSGCLLEGGRYICPRYENRLDDMLKSTSSLVDDNMVFGVILECMEKYNVVDKDILKLSKVKMQIEKAKESLELRQDKIANFKKVKTLPTLIRSLEDSCEILNTELRELEEEELDLEQALAGKYIKSTG